MSCSHQPRRTHCTSHPSAALAPNLLNSLVTWGPGRQFQHGGASQHQQPAWPIASPRIFIASWRTLKVPLTWITWKLLTVGLTIGHIHHSKCRGPRLICIQDWRPSIGAHLKRWERHPFTHYPGRNALDDPILLSCRCRKRFRVCSSSWDCGWAHGSNAWLIIGGWQHCSFQNTHPSYSVYGMFTNTLDIFG